MDLCQTIVQKLLQEIKRSNSPVLPSTKELAAQFVVSQSVVSRAARILRDRGLVTFTRGQRMHVPGRSRQVEPRRHVPSKVLLTSRLRGLIESGSLLAGQPLPKISTLAHEFNVSNTTVLSACSELAQAKLVYKKGKMWTVGSNPDQTRSVAAKGRPPVIIMLQHQERVWSALAQSSRTAKFCHEFEREAARYGVQTLSAFPNEQRAPVGATCVGREQLRELVRTLDHRYLGTLILSSSTEMPELNSWASELTSFHRPVAWFDRYDEPRAERPTSPLFTRCHFCERAAVLTAIEFLASMGHNVVAHPAFGAGGWQAARRALIETAAREAGITVHCVSSRDAGIEAGSGATDRKPAVYTPLFRQVFSHRDVTAIIAPYDYAAYYYYHWLSLNRVAVPEQVSLISFDNYPSIYSLPITTVDFGFGHLGYAAFHTLFGLVPVRRSRAGDITARPVVVDRGSVGIPRKGPLGLGSPGQFREPAPRTDITESD